MTININKIFNIAVLKKYPTSIVHFLTNRCNARCSFCFIDFDNPNTFKGELNLKEIDSLTKSLGKGLVNVNFTGGEPFARKDIIDIAKKYIINSEIESIYITTNGSLPDRVKNFLDEITNLKKSIELNFQISIDALPEQHNKIRKIKNLFENCEKTYHLINNYGLKNVNAAVAITVTAENCDDIEKIYNFLVYEKKLKKIKCILVRDEGIYKTADELKNKIFRAYDWLTNKIISDQKKNQIKNYNMNSMQGKIHNKKDEINYDLVKKIYTNNNYISPCHASSLFGIIMSNGDVYPCEILEDKKIGNLRDVDMNFMKLWDSDKNQSIKKFILGQKCKCTYECGLSFNVAGNYRYYPSLIKSIFDY